MKDMFIHIAGNMKLTEKVSIRRFIWGSTLRATFRWSASIAHIQIQWRERYSMVDITVH